MRQRVHQRGVDGQHRIELVRQADSVRLGDEPEENAIAVEAPGTALLDDLDARLVVAVEQLVGHSTGGGLVGELERLRTEPVGADDGHQAVGQDASDGRVRLEMFELTHRIGTRHSMFAGSVGLEV
jgi:hypothetical protein